MSVIYASLAIQRLSGVCADDGCSDSRTDLFHVGARKVLNIW